MIDAKIRFAVLAACLLAAIACRGQGIPADGQKQSFWLVEAEVPDSVAPGQIVSLADAAIVRQIDARYRIYGDTLASRQAEGRVTWFAIRDEGVVLVGANSRSEQLALSEGALYLPAGMSGLWRADSAKVTPCGEAPVMASAGSAAVVEAAGGFAFAEGDTVASTLMVCTYYSDDFGEYESRRWYAAGLVFPVVTVETLRAEAGELRTVLACPPSEQPAIESAPRRSSRSGNSDSGWQRLWGQAFSHEAGNAAIDYAHARGELPKGARMEIGASVRLIGFDGASDLSLVPLMVCDAAGRVLSRGVGEASLARLPAGCYLAAFAAGDNAYAIKFWIK